MADPGLDPSLEEVVGAEAVPEVICVDDKPAAVLLAGCDDSPGAVLGAMVGMGDEGRGWGDGDVVLRKRPCRSQIGRSGIREIGVDTMKMKTLASGD